MASAEMLWTVAKVRAGDGDVKVTFCESARFYVLQRANPSFERILSVLQHAEANAAPVRVSLNEPHGEIIESAHGS